MLRAKRKTLRFLGILQNLAKRLADCAKNNGGVCANTTLWRRNVADFMRTVFGNVLERAYALDWPLDVHRPDLEQTIFQREARLPLC